jgi:flagellar basal body rod protein FlgF
VTIDFNHPLAGESLVYTLKVSEVISDDEKKIAAILASLSLTVDVSKKEGNFAVSFKNAPAEKVEIGIDGTISIVPLGQPMQNLEIVGRLRIVTPNDTSPKQMEKGLDGFLRSKAGTTPQVDGRLMSGVLESSNVNTVQSLVDMISLQRKYEMQVKMMSTSNKNEEKSNSLLSLR